MGVDCGDYDNDGWLDFFMTSYQGEMPVLYRNLGSGVFEDVTQVSGAGEGAFPYVNWGNGFVDFDNDGGSGHVYRQRPHGRQYPLVGSTARSTRHRTC